MLCNANSMIGFRLNCSEGEIGKVQEFYFDDQHWTIRYLVADTGNWLLGRRVLLSPYSLGAISEEEQQIAVDLNRMMIENSPTLYTDKPVTREFEEECYQYYGWPMYWAGPNMWGAFSFIERDRGKWNDSQQNEKGWDPNLHSTRNVTGHSIQATDGEFGHVEDFIIDDETWAVRYLVIGTQKWWPGKRVLISPHWIERLDWSEARVVVNLSREDIKQSPEYTEKLLVTRDYEISLYKHYNRKGYWAESPDAKKVGPQIDADS